MNKCCNQKINTRQIDKNNWGAWCSNCGKKGTGKTAEIAINQLYNSNPVVAIIPQNPDQLINYAASNMNQIMTVSAPFVANDQPALKKMIANNIRYIKNKKDKNFMKAWTTPEGQESIVYALEESFSLGAQLGKMGDIVPFGNTVEFIPAVEAFEFALTNGKNAPFEWLLIEIVYKNDIRKIKRVNGDFTVEIEPGLPRGELLQVVVYGKNKKLGRVIGEVYDKPRLMDKAKTHSKSYKYYLKDKRALELAKSEGKDFILDYWKNKKHEEDIVNPYEGGDQPEMLRKVAGKSFLAPFIKVRNSEAAINEIKESENDNIESMIDNAMNEAMKIIPGEEVIQDDNKNDKKMDNQKEDESTEKENIQNNSNKKADQKTGKGDEKEPKKNEPSDNTPPKKEAKKPDSQSLI
jgi:hypothetical protein